MIDKFSCLSVFLFTVRELAFIRFRLGVGYVVILEILWEGESLITESARIGFYTRVEL